jgi:hypothetical protein
MLKTQLDFEQLLKRRYLAQIGRMQKKKLLQSTTEVERDHYVFLLSHAADHSLEKLQSLNENWKRPRPTGTLKGKPL